MSLNQLVTVNITTNSVVPTRPGFGTGLIAAYHTIGGSRRVLSASQPSDVSALGFSTTSPTYRALNLYFSQNPRPGTAKIGRRALPFTQTVRLAPQTTTQNDVISLTVNGTAISYTVPGSATTASVCTALAALIAAVSGCSGATGASGTYVSVPAAAGVLNEFVITTPSLLTYSNVTTDPGLATDLTAIAAEDNNWYGLLLDSNSQTEILAAAGWTESNQKLFIANTQDSAVLDPNSTTDVASSLKALAYARTGLLFSRSSNLSYGAAGWMGNRFPDDPGDDTWAYKTIVGLAADVLTDAQITAALNKNCSVYTTVAGVNVTQGGMCPGGEWLDITRFVDWLQSDIQIRIFTALTNNKKIPYTDLGVDMVVGLIKASLNAGIAVGGLASSPAYVVTAPLVANVSVVDRGKRNLPGISFQATLAGAIHNLVISGNVSV